MLLEIGKKYILRNGLETGKIRLSNNGTSYKIEANVKELQYKTKSVMSWLAGGHALTRGTENKHDITNILKK